MSSRTPHIHPLAARITHWISAAAIMVMISSGSKIYNASPSFAVVFPACKTLGGWLGGALAWHFAVMWLLAGNFTIYFDHGRNSENIRRRLFPLGPREICRDATKALRFRLVHDSSHHNAVQRLLYVLAGCGIALAIVPGLAIWNPVQLYPLAALLGATRLRVAYTSSPWYQRWTESASAGRSKNASGMALLVTIMEPRS